MSNDVDRQIRDAQEALRQRILQDPEEGWREFLRDYGPLIRNLVQRFHLTPEDREEIVQEVLHTLVKNDHKAIRGWDGEKASLPHYVAVVTTRTAITFTKSAFHQHTKRTFQAPDPEGADGAFDLLFEDPARSARERLHRADLVRSFRGALERLIEKGSIRREDFRLLLLRMNGLSYKEIERIVDVPADTLACRFARVKPIVRKALLELEITLEDLPRS